MNGAFEPSSLVQEAISGGLLPEEKRASATGYAGVIKIKGKYQARFYDKERRKQRAVPGLHETALHAALALARAKQMLTDAFENGEMIPSPTKRKRRRGAAAAPLPAAIAMPLAAACPQLPVALVQPL